MFNMAFPRFLCFFLFLIHIPSSKEIHLGSNIENIDFSETNEIFFTADDGFQILVSVENLNITNEGQYILIKAGSDIDDGYDGIIFMGFLNQPQQYLSLKNEIYVTCKEFTLTRRAANISEENIEDVVDLFEEGENSKPNCEEFEITVRRFGEGTTTTESPTTPIPWPTPSVNESDSITVNLTGPGSSWYTELHLNELKDSIADMAIEYCLINNIDGNISATNVLMDSIVQCPINWPNREKCVQITFRIPIIREDEDDYQLNTGHLEQMWSHHAHNYLPPEFSIYTLPESSVFTLWLIIICVIILLFCAILFLFKKFKQRLIGMNKRKKSVNSDQTNMIPTQSPRNSLHPHPKQIVPGMFESENPYYDPD